MSAVQTQSGSQLPLGAFAPLREKPSRGRGATPVTERTIRLEKPNPAGRSLLTFKFRPLKGWNNARLGAACELIVLYFRRLGGFRLADDAIVRAAYEILDPDTGYTYQEICWAIDAKVKSLQSNDPDERRAKRIYLGHPASFFSRNLCLWLERSDDYKAKVAKQNETIQRRVMDDIMARRCGTRPCSTGLKPVNDRSAAGAALETERQTFWQSLTAVQRMTARRAIRPSIVQQAQNQGISPDDPKLDPVAETMAINWARARWGLTDPNRDRQGAAQ